MTWTEPNPDRVADFLISHGYSSTAEPLRIEGSTRRYYRVRSTDGSRSAVLCVSSPFVEENDDFLSITDQLHRAGIRVPQLLGIRPEEGLLLQSDGGTHDVEQWFPTASLDEQKSAYRSFVSDILKMQSIPLEPPVAARFFDFEKLNWEMEFLFERVQEFMRLHRVDIFLSFEFRMFLQEVCAALGAQEPAVFVHRDLHSRNILSGSDGFTIIDYQDARTGNRYYDLVSLLFDPYLDPGKEIRDDCIQYYFEQTGLEKGRGILYLQALQRILKALGSYLYLGLEQKKESYLQCIEPAIARLEVIMHLGRFPDSVFLFLLDCRRKLLPALDL